MVFHAPDLHATQNVILQRQSLVHLAADAAFPRQSDIAQFAQPQLRLFRFLLFGELQLFGRLFDQLLRLPHVFFALPVFEVEQIVLGAGGLLFQRRLLLQTFQVPQRGRVLPLHFVAVTGLVGGVHGRDGEKAARAVDAARGTVHIGSVVGQVNVFGQFDKQADNVGPGGSLFATDSVGANGFDGKRTPSHTGIFQAANAQA